MTDTEALRRALAGFELLCGAFDAYLLADDGDTSEVIDALMEVEPIHLHNLADAARRWLALAEGGEDLRWRMTRVLLERFDYPSSTVYADAVDAILAAITEEGE